MSSVDSAEAMLEYTRFLESGADTCAMVVRGTSAAKSSVERRAAGIVSETAPLEHKIEEANVVYAAAIAAAVEAYL